MLGLQKSIPQIVYNFVQKIKHDLSIIVQFNKLNFIKLKNVSYCLDFCQVPETMQSVIYLIASIFEFSLQFEIILDVKEQSKGYNQTSILTNTLVQNPLSKYAIIFIMAYKTEVFIGPKPSEQSGLVKFLATICPCFKKKSNKSHKLETMSQKMADVLTINESELEDVGNYKQIQLLKNQNTKTTKADSIYRTATFSKDDSDVEDYFLKRSPVQSEIHRYVSVRRYEQDRLLLFGTKNKIFFKIHSKVIKMSPISAQKTKTALQKITTKIPTFPHPKMQGCWKKRYILFDKFDQGIKFDQQSYISTPPQCLSSYLSSRIRFNKLIHAYAGIGAYDIKLSNTCETVITTNCQGETIQCIENNLSIYMIDNVQISSQEFLNLEDVKSDAVLITPPWGNSYSINQQYDIDAMNLDKLFSKALTISSNVVIVLPSNLNIQKLGETLSRSLYDLSSPSNKNAFSSCSFQIQKIIFMDKIRFIVVYYGTQVSREVKLSDELDSIYEILGNNTFKCRRLTKYIREQYGLPFLLKLSLQAQSTKENRFQKLIEIIQRDKIVPDAKLKSFLNKNIQPNRQIVTRINDSPQQQITEEIRGSIRTNTYTNSFSSSYDLNAGGYLDGTRKTINVQCSESFKQSLKMSYEPGMTETKIL